MPHKYDPKTYSVICFSQAGRRAEEKLARNFQEARDLADTWKAEKGGTAAVLMCVLNNALMRPTLPEGEQQ